MVARPVPLLLGCLLSASAAAQVTVVTRYPVGSQPVAWSNTTGAGSPSLLATVTYPSVSAGAATPAATANGWPVVVFLHGYGWIGADYQVLANAWASAGFAVVMADTCQWDWNCQAQDGHAIYSAIVAENGAAGSPFAGAFDVQRIALVGHSMGGSTVGNILATNPGYRCGLTLAPVTPFGLNASSITVPFGIVVGMGDDITPWDWYSLPYYSAVDNYAALKFLYLMDLTCDHMNIAALAHTPTVADAEAVFNRMLKVSTGFLQHQLDLEPRGLESVIGIEGLAEPRLASLLRETKIPQLWMAENLSIGATTRASVAVEGSFAALIAAGARVPGLPTPFGLLLLDPLSAFPLTLGLANPERRVDMLVALPADPTLIGLPVALQALGENATQEWLLGNAVMLHVEQ